MNKTQTGDGTQFVQTPAMAVVDSHHSHAQNMPSCLGHDSDDMSQFLKTQSNMFQQVVSNMSMPRPESLCFSGDPLHYMKFKNSFDSIVGNLLDNDQAKLSYLIQYCKGEACECIGDCIILEPSKGYKMAREILLKHYGRTYIIAQFYILQLVDGYPIKSNDTTSLSKLALQMRKCVMTLEQIDYLSDLSNCKTIVKIGHRLPIHLKTKWVDIADRITEGGNEPKFHHLVDLIEERSHIATSIYGQDLLKTQGKVSGDSCGHTPQFSGHKKVATMTTEGEKYSSNGTRHWASNPNKGRGRANNPNPNRQQQTMVGTSAPHQVTAPQGNGSQLCQVCSQCTIHLSVKGFWS